MAEPNLVLLSQNAQLLCISHPTTICVRNIPYAYTCTEYLYTYSHTKETHALFTALIVMGPNIMQCDDSHLQHEVDKTYNLNYLAVLKQYQIGQEDFYLKNI